MYSRHGRDSNMNVMGTYAAFARGNQHACGEFLPAMGGGKGERGQAEPDELRGSGSMLPLGPG